jgi:hypothetical protein
MTSTTLALVAHLFISAYCLFGVWRCNLLTNDTLLDVFDREQGYFFSRNVLSHILIAACLLPFINGFQLYTTIRLELTAISDDLSH